VTIGWRKRVAFVIGAWMLVFGISAAAQTDPEPVALAAVILVASAVVWLATDLSELAERGEWSTYALASGRRRGGDARVNVLQRALVDIATREDAARIHPVLVELIDDRLAAHHGLDRTTDPELAAAILGDDLVAFIETPPISVYLGNPNYLSRIITHIEQL
jgi:hypothetical protein